MRYFYGEEKRPIDAKHRIVMPSRFRGQMMTPEGRAEIFITRGTDSCLYIYPRETWDKIRSQFTDTSFASAEERRVLRLFFASVNQQTADKQGRITLPENLRALGGLTGECIFVGVQDHVELWEPKRWEAYCAEGAEDYENSLDRFRDQLAKGLKAKRDHNPGLPANLIHDLRGGVRGNL